MSQHVKAPIGGVIVVAVIGETKILLIKETTKPFPHYWKMVSEKLLPDDSILGALCRAVDEEAGLKDLHVRKVEGQTVEIRDSRVKVTRQLIPSHIVQSSLPHRRHFWGLATSDDIIKSLSGKHLSGDVNEEIETMMFSLSQIEGMVDLLPGHRELITKISHGAFA